MSKALLLQQLNELFRDVLNNDAIVLENHTTAKDIEEWDSLNHIQLVVAIEKKFSVRFKSLEIYYRLVGLHLNALKPLLILI